MLKALLVEPWTFFRRRNGDLDGIRGVVVGAAASFGLVTVLGVALWFLSRQFSGTVTMDNPARPADTFCNGTQFENTTPAGCSEPARIDREMGSLVWERASELLPWLFFGALVVFFLSAVGLYAGSWLAEGDGSFGATLEVTAWGMIPSVVGTVVAGVVLVGFASQMDLSADDPEQVLQQFRAIQRGVSGLTLGAVQLLTATWQAYVWAGGLFAVQDLHKKTAGGIAAFVSLVPLLFTL